MPNVSTVREFLLLELSDIRELQLVYSALFLLVYLGALTGNLLIVAVTALDRRLHTPMYFFLRNLSIVDLCYISVTVPKSAVISLTDRRAISLLGCAAQVFLVVVLATSELAVLTAMSYDRYAAICHPLDYELIMNNTACGKMAAASWLIGVMVGVLYSASTFSLSFCGSNIIQQFFCDIPSLLKISCSEDHVIIDVSITGGVVLVVICFVCIVVSYVSIFLAVLRKPAAESRTKAFSTCLPHLTVVIVFLLTGAVAYLKPVSESTSTLDLLVSMSYTMMPPTLNPVIYSLRNRDMKAALGRVLKGRFLLPPLRDKMFVHPHPGYQGNHQPGSDTTTEHRHDAAVTSVVSGSRMSKTFSANFFFDVPSLLKITCFEDHSTINVSVTFALIMAAVSSISIVASYVRIFWDILRMLAA
ncbi:olfactory receptor 14A16-like [Tachyglossus aculeatus]|uniref:olfactory receptor 14A16-like n=1 Tax=Tachyglossus aculeatus TaxID=9261 RepID=UPI0018F7A530|nr:olfactory receptor 14A16-like [Tachyglossus aculeatus]